MPKPKPARTTSTNPDDAAIEEFKRLFKAAQREHRRAGRMATADSSTHQAALRHAKMHHIPGGEAMLAALLAVWNEVDLANNLETLNAARKRVSPAITGNLENLAGMLLEELGQHEAAIDCYERALAIPGYDTPGDTHNSMGLAYHAQGEHDRAIECYQKALASPGYDTPGNAHHNMGNAYVAKGEYDQAIEYYQKALASPGYDTPGRAHENIGLAYHAKGEHNRAIECYQKALASPGYDTPGDAHYNMGLAYHAQGEHDQAIECYQKVLASPGYNTPGDAHHNMGNAYIAKGEYDRAIECYQKALVMPGYDTPGDAYNNMGNAHVAKGEHGQAIECYQKALAMPGYDTPGDAHYNMGNAHVAKGEHDRAIECYQKALASPGYDKPGNAYNNMGAAYAAKGEHDRAIECYQKALASPGYDTPGRAHENIGLAYRAKGEHDRAIECYQKALASPGYDTPGRAHSNMGNAYADKGEHDRAIECYQKALASPGYDTPGDAHYNMGATYADKGEYDRAIECYQKALATPGYDTPGDAHHNMGATYSDKDEYDRAIGCYQKALATPGYDTPHLTRLNLALNLRKLGRLEEAMSEIDAVLAEPDLEKQHNRARYIKGLVEEELAGLKPSATEQALAKPVSGKTGNDADSPEARIVGKLQGSKSLERDKYDVYLRRETKKRDDVFSCLRGWSSAVTLLEGGQDTQWQGGGYFLKWRGRGIVIDPGFDFLDNFHDAGYNGREIDAVLVSHNHPDHNYDLGSVDDLRYELHRRWKVIPEAERKSLDLSKCLFVIDEDTARAFKHDSPEHRRSPLKIDRANYEHQRWLEGTNGLPLNIEHFPVKHGEDVPGAMGMKLRLLGPDGKQALVIGYTGDSEYSEGFASHLEGCDILLAHISMPDPEEYTDEKHLKKKHLGYNGMTKLIERTKPRLTLVGEFWAGLADLRIDLTQGLRQRTKTAAILPIGLGFHLHLPTLEVECTCCRKRVPCDSIRVAPASTPFGRLGYLCERCLV